MSLIKLSEWMESQVEIWLPVVGTGYDVSNFGRVRSFYKSGASGWDRQRTPRILKPWSTKQGYKQVAFPSENRMPMVHRLVAITFLHNPERLPEVNHRTLVKGDNRLENLEWVSSSTNAQHASRAGVLGAGKGEGHHAARLTNEEVRQIRAMYTDGYNQSQLGRMFSISRDTIHRIVHNRAWTHI